MPTIEYPIREMRLFHKEALRQLELLGKGLERFRVDGKRDFLTLSMDGFFLFAKNDLAVHIRDEEGAMFPILRRYTKLVDKLLGDHDYIDASVKLLETLRGMKKANDSEIDKKIKEVIQTFRDHIWKEENVIFKVAEERLTEEQISEIAERMALFRGGKEAG